MAIFVVMGMAFLAPAIFTSAATFMFFLVMNNHLAGIRADIQALTPDHIDIFLWQDSHPHQILENLTGFRIHSSDIVGMNKDVAVPLIALGHGRGESVCGIHCKLSGKVDVQIAVALVGLNVIHCVHVSSPGLIFCKKKGRDWYAATQFAAIVPVTPSLSGAFRRTVGLSSIYCLFCKVAGLAAFRQCPDQLFPQGLQLSGLEGLT